MCKICGCSIKDCRSVKGCACPNETKPQFLTKENNSAQSHTQPRKKLKNTAPKQPSRRKTVSCPHRKSIGVICFPEKVDMAVCVDRVSEVQREPPKKCYCIKCENRSVDGSCYCSHCLGIFDKSVAIKPSNKEIATQCACDKSKRNCNGNEKMSDIHNENYIIIEPTVENNSNISGIEKEQREQATNSKQQPDISYGYDNLEFITFSPNNSDSEVKKD